MRSAQYLVFTLILPTLIFAGTPVVVNNPQVLFYVEKNLPHTGILRQTQDGFLYIELPRDYVFGVLPLIQNPSLSPPPYFAPDQVGAHITVATAQEISQAGFPTTPYLGQSIPFSILNLSKVKIENNTLGSEIYLLTVESTTITKIRSTLSLPPKIQDYDFHITVGVER